MDRSLADSFEPLGSERGIVTKVEVDVALERAIAVESGPAAAAHIVSLVGAVPRELNARPAITIRVAAVEFSPHSNEAEIGKAVVIELDEARLDQIDGLLIPVIHLSDTPPAYDARALGHATRVVFVRAGSATADPAPFLIVGAAARVPGMLPAVGAFLFLFIL